ncbi:MAG TPA: M20/M25/M40 family metallo-hydrolase [Ignavibacteriaceae bacterium]|nr:M20/M25/M40 family metallo-hydrolase [Ignavibacteriaceae bacterium]
MKYLLSTISAFVLVLSFSITNAQIIPGYEEGLQIISKEALQQHLTFLASDSLKGRAAGTDENLIASLYIAEKFREAGLQPLFPSRSKFKVEEDEPAGKIEVPTFELVDAVQYEGYFQRFALKKSRYSDKGEVKIIYPNDNSDISISYKYKNDYMIQYANGKNLSITTPLIFAGYGIEKGENGYNDYIGIDEKEIDVSGRFVIIVDGHPQDKDPESSFSKTRNAYYRNVLRKAEVAADRGAAGVVVISSTLKLEPVFNFKYQNLVKAFDKTSYSLPENIHSRIPIIYASNVIADEMFRGSGTKLDSVLKKIDRTLKPNAFEITHKMFCAQIEFDSEIVITQNVIGFLEGTDPELKNEYVVIAAHMDHVGFGEYGAMDKINIGQIHNGADDNASGTSAIIEMAKAFSKVRPKRSMVFIAFNAEENGLLGARYYVYHQPVKPIENTIAMLNFDMVGRNEPELLWVGGAFFGEDLIKIAETANSHTGFELLYNMGLLSGASDHAYFLRKKIPALFFFSGLHDDYHTPSDDIEKIDFDKLKRVTQLGYLTGWIVANSDGKPAWREMTLEERAVIVKDSKERQDAIRKPKN